MRAKELILTVLKDGVDYTKQSYDFSKNNFNITMGVGEYLYIGYFKRINNIFFELATANTGTSEITAEVWDGSNWVAIEIFDKTNGLENSGFIFLDEKYENEETEVSGVTQHFVRFSVDSATSALTFRGINCVFCDEDDLSLEEPNIAEFYPETMNSHILSMVAARQFIIQKMRNEGNIKFDSNAFSALTVPNGEIKNITQFDFFDIEDVKMMSVYFSLYKIFFNISDGVDDQYYIKAQDYLTRFENNYKTYIMKIDTDDDGTEDIEEVNNITNKFNFDR